MKLIAEGKFSDGFNGISIVQFFEGETTNKIVESYRGAIEEYEVEREYKWETGKYFMSPFYRNETKYHFRYSEMLESIKEKGIKR